jgi:hypothetical protein
MANTSFRVKIVTMQPIQDFASDLAAIPEYQFTHDRLLEFLRTNRVDPATLAPYLYFSPERYTRNLISKTPLFDLIAICWESGQKSAIHNHRDQNCWMAAAYGKVQVLNFKLIRKDRSIGFCELTPGTHYLIMPDSPQEVDPEEPIHQVLNPSSFGSRAVTLHIYSRPFDTCEVYDLKEKKYRDVILENTSEYGVLKSDIKVEKVCL